MLGALKIGVILVAPPSLLATYDHLVLVPLYYGAVNLWFGYLFWRHRVERMSVVMTYLLSGIFLFRFLVDPLEVSALPPLPAPPPMALAGSPAAQAKVGASDGSRWTDWMRPEAARLKPSEVTAPAGVPALEPAR